MRDSAGIPATLVGFCLFLSLSLVLVRFPQNNPWLYSPLQLPPLTLFLSPLEGSLLWHRQYFTLCWALQLCGLKHIKRTDSLGFLPPHVLFTLAFSLSMDIHWPVTPKDHPDPVLPNPASDQAQIWLPLLHPHPHELSLSLQLSLAAFSRQNHFDVSYCRADIKDKCHLSLYAWAPRYILGLFSKLKKKLNIPPTWSKVFIYSSRLLISDLLQELDALSSP